MQFTSKLPNLGTTIFSVMSALANKHGAINLSQGFPNFDCDPVLKDLVTHYVQEGHNQYCPMVGLPALTAQLAQKIERLYGTIYDPAQEINITSGATQAIFSAIHAFVHPGDEVIIVEPAYDCYGPSIQLAGGVVRPYAITAPDWKIDWEALGQLVTPKTRMILLNSPHNPSGSLLTAADFEALTALVKDTNILILSDEVYEHLVFDEQEHASILRYPALRERSLAVYSFGKTLHVTGWKLGYIVGDKALMKEFRKVHQFDVFSSNTPMQYAIADYLKDEKVYLHLAPFFQAKRDFFLEQLKDSAWEFTPSAGTYFQVASYANISDEPDTAFAKRLTIEHGVAVIPLSVFYHNNLDHKVVRFCFAKTEDVLEQAGERLRLLLPA
ncbi:MAG: methionine aminotransferase [Aureispira sp.]